MGNPVGPRIPPQVVTDESGTYIIFPGKTCRAGACGVALTSRNRHWATSLCRTHGLMKDRNKGRKIDTLEEPYANVSDPQRFKMHRVFARWLSDPTEREANEGLKAAMVDFELRFRFAYHDLPKPSLEIPVEEPVFSKPHHRTTHLEYIAACESLGV